MRYLRFSTSKGSDLTSYVHAHGVTPPQAQGPLVGVPRRRRLRARRPHDQRRRPLRPVQRVLAARGGLPSSWAASSASELETQPARTARAAAGAADACASTSGSALRRCPTVAANARSDCDPEKPGFVMELRGYTLRDRPLYYQCVYADPFAERLLVVR